MSKRTQEASIAGRRFFVALLSIALVCAFGLHDVQLEHTHYHAEGETHESGPLPIAEYFHAMERKVAVVVVSIFAFWLLHLMRVLEVAKRQGMMRALRPRRLVPALQLRLRLFDVHAILFSRGILHPRVYS